jgi:hypothetical protein
MNTTTASAPDRYEFAKNPHLSHPALAPATVIMTQHTANPAPPRFYGRARVPGVGFPYFLLQPICKTPIFHLDTPSMDQSPPRIPQAQNWPGEREPSSHDVSSANDLPEPAFLSGFKSCLLADTETLEVEDLMHLDLQAGHLVPNPTMNFS